MARLAEYMQNLASLFGESEGVHFSRLEKGSTRVIAALRGRASQIVQSRVISVRNRTASVDAQKAYDRINEMVAADGTNARITFGASVVLRFPGNTNRALEAVSIVETGTVTGRLYALLEDGNGRLNARIRPRDGNNYVTCTADGSIGRELRKYFQDAVRVTGKGTWTRSDAGVWTCAVLRISSIQPVKNVFLRDAINELRAIEAHWPEDVLSQMDLLEERGGAA